MFGWLRNSIQRDRSIARVASAHRDRISAQVRENLQTAGDAITAAHGRQANAEMSFSAAESVRATLLDLLKLVTR